MELFHPHSRAKRCQGLSSRSFCVFLLLSQSICGAFQLNPTQNTKLLLTSVASSRNNEDSADNSDFNDGESLEMYEISKAPPQPIRKFTGASSNNNLFTNGNNEQYSSSPSSNIQREREREFNLASNFERTFGIQAVLLLAAIIYVASVGLSGGITDGSERNFYGEDEVDGIVIEQLERIRTDDAAGIVATDPAVSVRI